MVAAMWPVVSHGDPAGVARRWSFSIRAGASICGATFKPASPSVEELRHWARLLDHRRGHFRCIVGRVRGADVRARFARLSGVSGDRGVRGHHRSSDPHRDASALALCIRAADAVAADRENRSGSARPVALSRDRIADAARGHARVRPQPERRVHAVAASALREHGADRRADDSRRRSPRMRRSAPRPRRARNRCSSPPPATTCVSLCTPSVSSPRL